MKAKVSDRKARFFNFVAVLFVPQTSHGFQPSVSSSSSRPMPVPVVSKPPPHYYSADDVVRLGAVPTEQQTSWGMYNATSEERSRNKHNNHNEIRNLFDMGQEEERNGFDSEQTTSSSSSSSGLIPLSDEEREELKRQCAEIIERVISGGVDDLNRLHDSWKDKYEDQRRLRDAMQLNYLIQEKAFDDKVDEIISRFMSDTQNERDKTHRLFEEDEVKRRIQENEATEKKKPKPIEPWGITNNEFDDWDRWDDWNW